MTRQTEDADLSDIESTILGLELKYFEIIKDIIKSDTFTNDLQLIEKEISDNYGKFDDLWNLKNKIKVPAERVVRHHLYISMKDIITGIFPSPLSSDFGVRTKDAVVCVDIKTIDTDNNSSDLKSISVEKNQTSFNNKNYLNIQISHNMNDYDDYSKLPILTYVVRIIYTDNKVNFSLCRDPRWYTVSLACIPNGKLSKLFGYNIVENCKTYEYYDPKNDGPQYEPIFLSKDEYGNDIIVDNKCMERGLQKFKINKKNVYIDQSRVIWWKTTINKKYCVAPLKGGYTVRFNIEYLKYRFDSNNKPWLGYEEWIIADNPFLSGQYHFN